MWNSLNQKKVRKAFAKPLSSLFHVEQFLYLQKQSDKSIRPEIHFIKAHIDKDTN